MSLPDLRNSEAGIRNGRLGTEHPHQFSSPLSMATMVWNYPGILLRHYRRCISTRAALNGSKRLLLVIANATDEEVRSIDDALRRYNPNLDFVLAAVSDDLSDDWRGDDAVWSAALARFHLSASSPPLGRSLPSGAVAAR